MVVNLPKLRIAFHNVNFSSSTGPNVFCTRLAKQFFLQDHILMTPGEKCDIDFVNIVPSATCRGKKTIQRLDGIWTRGIQDIALNAPILQQYTIADHVIWQSEYDKKLITKFWHDRSGSVVHNGCQINHQLDIDLMSKIRDLAEVIFCASASWHPQKRLEANIEAMRSYAKHTHKTCCLIVLGHVSKQISGNDIYYVSHVEEKIYFSIYAASDAFLHLAWRDHCPNVVIEALSCGTPVICASSGGTSELLVQNAGVVIDDEQDSTINDLVFDFDKPPMIKIPKFELPNRNSFDTTKYMIENVAKTYESIMLGLLDA